MSPQPRAFEARSLLPFAVILFLGAWYLLTVARWAGTYGADPSVYRGLAESLAAGRGYVFDGRLHTQYPPGLPLLLVPFVALDRAVPGVIPVVMALWGLAAMWMTYVFLRGHGEPYALPITVLVGLSPIYYAASAGAVISELPYLAFSLGFIAWAEKGESHPDRGGSSSWLVLGMLLLAGTILLRTIGIALLAACGLWLIHRRLRAVRDGVTWRDGAVLASGAAAFLGWTAWSLLNRHAAYPGELTQSYFDQFRLVDPHHPDLGLAGVGDILARLPRAAIAQSAHAAEVLTGLAWVRPSWSSPLIALVFLVAGAGWWIELRGPRPLAAWYALCYAGVLLLWPFDEGQRFLIPVLPLLFLFFVAGGRAVSAWLGDRRAWTRMVVPAGAGVWLIGLAVAAADIGPRRTSIYRLGPDGVPDVPARYAAQWVEANTAPGDVVMAADFATLHYWTHRLVVPLPITGRADILVPALERTRPRFVVIETPPPNPYYLPVEPERFAVLERALPGQFERAWTFPGGEIYRWRPVEPS